MFTPQLREKTLRLHTPEQLNGHINTAWVNQRHFVSYLRRRERVHRVLDDVINVDTGLLPRLHTDLSSLDIDWKRIPSDYTDYLLALRNAPGNRPALIAHYYAFTLAHLVGGGKQIAASASHVLPPWFLDQSAYYNALPPHAPDILDCIDQEASYWSRDDDRMCLDELTVAFRFGMVLLRQK